MATEYTWAIANLERNTDDDMVPFADLTPEIVTGWVKSHFGNEKVAEIEVALQAQLDEQRAPTKAAGVPWAA